MEIVFRFPHVFLPGASDAENAAVLECLLEALIGIDRDYLRRHPATRPLRDSGIVYGRTLEWEPYPAMIERGHADCKSLTAQEIAELREKGVQARPVFRWVRRPNGRKDFHILVLTASGFSDPSKRHGMGANEIANLY